MASQSHSTGPSPGSDNATAFANTPTVAGPVAAGASDPGIDNLDTDSSPKEQPALRPPFPSHTAFYDPVWTVEGRKLYQATHPEWFPEAWWHVRETRPFEQPDKLPLSERIGLFIRSKLSCRRQFVCELLPDDPYTDGYFALDQRKVCSITGISITKAGRAQLSAATNAPSGSDLHPDVYPNLVQCWVERPSGPPDFRECGQSFPVLTIWVPVHTVGYSAKHILVVDGAPYAAVQHHMTVTHKDDDSLHAHLGFGVVRDETLALPVGPALPDPWDEFTVASRVPGSTEAPGWPSGHVSTASQSHFVPFLIFNGIRLLPFIDPRRLPPSWDAVPIRETIKAKLDKLDSAVIEKVIGIIQTDKNWLQNATGNVDGSTANRSGTPASKSGASALAGAAGMNSEDLNTAKELLSSANLSLSGRLPPDWVPTSKADLDRLISTMQGSSSRLDAIINDQAQSSRTRLQAYTRRYIAVDLARKTRIVALPPELMPKAAGDANEAASGFADATVTSSAAGANAGSNGATAAQRAAAYKGLRVTFKHEGADILTLDKTRISKAYGVSQDKLSALSYHQEIPESVLCAPCYFQYPLLTAPGDGEYSADREKTRNRLYLLLWVPTAFVNCENAAWKPRTMDINGHNYCSCYLKIVATDGPDGRMQVKTSWESKSEAVTKRLPLAGSLSMTHDLGAFDLPPLERWLHSPGSSTGVGSVTADAASKSHLRQQYCCSCGKSSCPFCADSLGIQVLVEQIRARTDNNNLIQTSDVYDLLQACIKSSVTACAPHRSLRDRLQSVSSAMAVAALHLSIAPSGGRATQTGVGIDLFTRKYADEPFHPEDFRFFVLQPLLEVILANFCSKDELLSALGFETCARANASAYFQDAAQRAEALEKDFGFTSTAKRWLSEIYLYVRAAGAATDGACSGSSPLVMPQLPAGSSSYLALRSLACGTVRFLGLWSPEIWRTVQPSNTFTPPPVAERAALACEDPTAPVQLVGAALQSARKFLGSEHFAAATEDAGEGSGLVSGSKSSSAASGASRGAASSGHAKKNKSAAEAEAAAAMKALLEEEEALAKAAAAASLAKKQKKGKGEATASKQEPTTAPVVIVDTSAAAAGSSQAASSSAPAASSKPASLATVPGQQQSNASTKAAASTVPVSQSVPASTAQLPPRGDTSVATSSKSASTIAAASNATASTNADEWEVVGAAGKTTSQSLARANGKHFDGASVVSSDSFPHQQQHQKRNSTPAPAPASSAASKPKLAAAVAVGAHAPASAPVPPPPPPSAAIPASTAGPAQPGPKGWAAAVARKLPAGAAPAPALAIASQSEFPPISAAATGNAATASVASSKGKSDVQAAAVASRVPSTVAVPAGLKHSSASTTHSLLLPSTLPATAQPFVPTASHQQQLPATTASDDVSDSLLRPSTGPQQQAKLAMPPALVGVEAPRGWDARVGSAAPVPASAWTVSKAAANGAPASAAQLQSFMHSGALWPGNAAPGLASLQLDADDVRNDASTAAAQPLLDAGHRIRGDNDVQPVDAADRDRLDDDGDSPDFPGNFWLQEAAGNGSAIASVDHAAGCEVENRPQVDAAEAAAVDDGDSAIRSTGPALSVFRNLENSSPADYGSADGDAGSSGPPAATSGNVEGGLSDQPFAPTESEQPPNFDFWKNHVMVLELQRSMLLDKVAQLESRNLAVETEALHLRTEVTQLRTVVQQLLMAQQVQHQQQQVLRPQS